MPQGTIDAYDPDQQQGFIVPEGSGDRVPFTLDDVRDHRIDEPLTEGEGVTYEVDRSDSPHAVNVRRIAPRGYG